MISSQSTSTAPDAHPYAAVAPATEGKALTSQVLTSARAINDTNISIANLTTILFPSTVLQVPVLTICSAIVPSSSLISAAVFLTNATTVLNNTSSKRSLLKNSLFAFHATVHLPGIVSTSPTATLAEATTRIVLGVNVCQTMF